MNCSHASGFCAIVSSPCPAIKTWIAETAAPPAIKFPQLSSPTQGRWRRVECGIHEYNAAEETLQVRNLGLGWLFFFSFLPVWPQSSTRSDRQVTLPKSGCRTSQEKGKAGCFHTDTQGTTHRPQRRSQGSESSLTVLWHKLKGPHLLPFSKSKLGLLNGKAQLFLHRASPSCHSKGSCTSNQFNPSEVTNFPGRQDGNGWGTSSSTSANEQKLPS